MIDRSKETYMIFLISNYNSLSTTFREFSNLMLTSTL